MSGGYMHAKPFYRLWSVLVGCVMAVSVMSCNDTDDNPEYRDATVTNMVTYIGMADGAVFEYISIDDAPSVMLRTTVSIDRDVASGQRYIMTYYPIDGDESASGFIEPVSLAAVTTLGISEKDISHYPQWDESGIYLLSAWRSGSYINIRCKLPFSESPRVLALVPSSEDEGVFYLAHQVESGATFDRAYYISFDMSRYLSDHPSLDAIKIHVNNTNLMDNVLTFPL